MKKSILFVLVLFQLSFAGCSQSKTQEIRVQIFHNQEVYLDTVISEEPDEAKKIIEQLVSRYSSGKIEIAEGTIHGLYVFNVPEKDWKGNMPSSSSDKNLSSREQIEINIDSLFNKFNREMDKQWREFDMEETRKEAKESIERFREEAKPEIQELKKELKEMIEKMRTTQIIIIQKGDTITVP